jgi:hypothetical protein
MACVTPPNRSRSAAARGIGADRLGREDRSHPERTTRVLSPPLRRFIVLAVLVLPPAAVADVTTPSRPAPAATATRQTSMATRWPALPSCAGPHDLTVRSPSSKDVLRWSNAAGAALTLVDDSHGQPLPPAFLRDPPGTLTWVRRGRPDQLNSGDMPVSPHRVNLLIYCGSSSPEGYMSWSCDDQEASCSLSVARPYRDPAEQRRHRRSLADLARIVEAGAGARDLVTADAVRFAQDACAGGRCGDVVARAVEQLGAVGKQPPWTVAPAREQWFELKDPRRPGNNLLCDATINRYCALNIGSTSFLIRDGGKDGRSESAGGSEWGLVAYGSYFEFSDGAVR